MNPLLLGVGLASVALLAAVPRRSPAQPPAGRAWTWAELTASPTARRLGLDNTPPADVARTLAAFADAVLGPLRARYPGVRVNSGYRTPAVNRAVGGVEGSLHTGGLALDLAGTFLTDPGSVAFLRSLGLKVLVYDNHVHVEPNTAVTRG